MSANYEKDEVKFFDVPPIEKRGVYGYFPWIWASLWLLPPIECGRSDAVSPTGLAFMTPRSFLFPCPPLFSSLSHHARNLITLRWPWYGIQKPTLAMWRGCVESESMFFCLFGVFCFYVLPSSWLDTRLKYLRKLLRLGDQNTNKQPNKWLYIKDVRVERQKELGSLLTLMSHPYQPAQDWLFWRQSPICLSHCYHGILLLATEYTQSWYNYQ